jgi:hypothetical protein
MKRRDQTFLPASQDWSGFLYVIRFHNGIIEVGRTDEPTVDTTNIASTPLG